MKTLAYKILTAQEWAEFQANATFPGSAVDLADGFIHLSTATQLTDTADKHFAGRNGLVVLAVDLSPLGHAVRWEPSRGGALFPHIHGPLPITAIYAATAMQRGPDGRVVLPEATA